MDKDTLSQSTTNLPFFYAINILINFMSWVFCACMWACVCGYGCMFGFSLWLVKQRKPNVVGGPLTLHLHPIHYVDSANVSHDSMCAHCLKIRQCKRKKTPNGEQGVGPGAHPKPAGRQLQRLHLCVNFTLLPGAQRCCLLFFVCFCYEHMPMRVV